MFDLFFSGPAPWFTIPAFIGTLFFALRLGLMMTGIGLDLHTDGAGDAVAEHADPDDGFKLISIQSLLAFSMGFGWAGLGALRGAGWEVVPSIVVGVAGGVAIVWLLALLLKAVHDLQQSGNIPTRLTVGLEGDVYVSVPAARSGRGQVRVTVGQRQRFYPAVSDSDALPTGTRIRVVSVEEGSTLSVEKS